MKKLISLLSLFLCMCLVLTGCNEGGNNGNSGNEDYNAPKNIMTTEEYHASLDALLETENFSAADEAYLAKIDELSSGLKDMIAYNDDDLTTDTGTTYYVSNNGNDDNDGKSPETAWATLQKVNGYVFGEGDLVVFERGSLWRGYLSVKSNVSYSAYGEGPKPKIWASTDGLTHGEWKQTENANIWVLDKKLTQTDLGLIIFNGGEYYGEQKRNITDVKKNFDFLYKSSFCTDGAPDFKVYLYYDGGNPAEVFSAIDLNLDTKIITNGIIQNVHINNLELRYGRGPFWAGGSTNLKMSYCVCEWSGGFADTREGARYGGGSGCYGSCDGFVYDFCYFNQQFDSGVSPQYDYEDKTPVVNKDFITTNCLFENIEYTLEYFNSQENTLENRFENMQFNYNICRLGGYGFGTKASISAYIKSWGHENSCYDCVISHNIFDRALSLTLEIIGYEQSESGNTLSYDRIPELKSNIYIQKKNKKFANINKTIYKFNEETYNRLESLGVDTGSVYMFSN